MKLMELIEDESIFGWIVAHIAGIPTGIPISDD